MTDDIIKLDNSNIRAKADYLSMVSEDGWLIKAVPIEYRDKTICETAIDNADIQITDNYSILSLIPCELRDRDMCLRAIKKDGAAIRDVPEDVKTYEMCYLAIQENGKELDMVPLQFRDEKMCLAAVSDDGVAILAVSEALRTEELWRIALRTRPEFITSMPNRFRTQELYVYLCRHAQKAQIDFSYIRKAFPERIIADTKMG